MPPVTSTFALPLLFDAVRPDGAFPLPRRSPFALPSRGSVKRTPPHSGHIGRASTMRTNPDPRRDPRTILSTRITYPALRFVPCAALLCRALFLHGGLVHFVFCSLETKHTPSHPVVLCWFLHHTSALLLPNGGINKPSRWFDYFTTRGRWDVRGNRMCC